MQLVLWNVFYSSKSTIIQKSILVLWNVFYSSKSTIIQKSILFLWNVFYSSKSTIIQKSILVQWNVFYSSKSTIIQKSIFVLWNMFYSSKSTIIQKSIMLYWMFITSPTLSNECILSFLHVWFNPMKRFSSDSCNAQLNTLFLYCDLVVLPHSFKYPHYFKFGQKPQPSKTWTWVAWIVYRVVHKEIFHTAQRTNILSTPYKDNLPNVV
jgi:hypothetical protein